MSLSKQNRWGFGKKEPASPSPEPQMPEMPMVQQSPTTEPQENLPAAMASGGAVQPKFVTPSPSSFSQGQKPKKEANAPEDPYYEMKANIHRRLIEEIDLTQLSEKGGSGLRAYASRLGTPSITC